MQRRTLLKLAAAGAAAAAVQLPFSKTAFAAGKDIVYITPGLDLPFWVYLSKGVEAAAKEHGYGYQVLDSHNNPQNQLQNAQDAIARGVAGIVISPTDSSTAPSVQALAKKANIPVVIADIGTNGGDYESFIISDNYKGAHGVGVELAGALKKKGWESETVGIVAISQARKNGQARTKGFLDGLTEGGFKGTQATMQQMQTYTADETFKFVQDMLTANPNLRGLFVQTDQPCIGALRAIKAARRTGDILVTSFDGLPAFVDLLKKGEIVATGMQQPFLMGQRSAEALFDSLDGKKPEKEITVPILVVTADTIEKELPTIRKTVFAGEI